MDDGTMKSVHVRYYTQYGIEVQEGLSNQKGDSSMYYPDSSVQKVERRKKIRRDRQEKFDDRIKEKRIRKPRNKNVRYSNDYDEWIE